MKNLKVQFILLYLNILILFPLHAQNIQVQLYLLNPCDSSIKKLDLYELNLKRTDTIFRFAAFDTLPLVLKDTGIYVLSAQYIYNDVNLKIKNFGKYVDTINQATINKVFTVDQKPSFHGWVCCDEKCNGYQVDYYSNGNKRIEGIFKNGQPIGELKYFREDGTLLYIQYFSKRGKYIRRKDFPD